MSYATSFQGMICVTGLPESALQLLDDIDPEELHKQVGQFVPKRLSAPSSYTGTIFIRDFSFERNGQTLCLVGTEYCGGSRYNVDKQLKAILEYLRAAFGPGLSFSGVLLWCDDEGVVNTPEAFCVTADGSVLTEYQTRLAFEPGGVEIK